MTIPNRASDGGQSAVTRENVNDWLSRTWSTRLNPGGLGVNILTQQRVHETDASGYWLSKDDSNSIVKLIIPMEYEESRKCKTIILPSTNGKPWEDPRTKEGELLCPNYLGEAAIKERKAFLGSYGYAGQYQQRPAPEAGGLIKREWFKLWTKEKMPKFLYTISSWDTALTVNEDSAYSACTTWGVFQDTAGYNNVMLLTAWRGKLNYVDLVERARRLYDNYLDIYDEYLEPDYMRTPDRLLVEAKASGLPLVSDFVSKGIPATAFLPDEFGDKMQRVHMITPFIECGRIWVATDGPESSQLLPDHEMHVMNCTLFPKAESRDLVDTMTQAFLYLSKKMDMLRHVMSPRFEDEPKYMGVKRRDV